MSSTSDKNKSSTEEQLHPLLDFFCSTTTCYQFYFSQLKSLPMEDSASSIVFDYTSDTPDLVKLLDDSNPLLKNNGIKRQFTTLKKIILSGKINALELILSDDSIDEQYIA